MKSEFKAKLVNHLLNKKNSEQGFTLIELLVVIIIIGILAAIALPSFLNQAAKARQSEAKTYVGSMNRTQQAYYLEKQRFAPTLDALAVGIANTTANYSYSTTGSARGVVGTNANGYSRAVPSLVELKAYVGAVNVATPAGTTEATTLATLCEAKLPQVNGGATTADIATVDLPFTLALNAAPVCDEPGNTGFVAVQ